MSCLCAVGNAATMTHALDKMYERTRHINSRPVIIYAVHELHGVTWCITHVLGYSIWKNS